MEIKRCLVSLMFAILHSKANKLPWWIFIKHKLVICYPITWLQRYVVPSFKSRVHQAVWHTAPSHEAAEWIKHMYSDMEMCYSTFYPDVIQVHILRGNILKNVSETIYLALNENNTFRLPSDFTFLYLRFIFIMIKTFHFQLGGMENLKWEFMWLCRTDIGPGRNK